MGWIKTHKLLIIIYVAGISLGLMELGLPGESVGTLDRPEAYVGSAMPG